MASDVTSRDGMNYAPVAAVTKKVVAPGEFNFAATHFDHGHIFGQIGGLADAGGTLKYIYEPDPAKLGNIPKSYPDAKIVSRYEDILEDDSIQLVTSAAIPSERCNVGLQALDAGKDYFTDKSPFTTLEQLDLARAKVKETGRRYMVYFGERLSNESSWYAGKLIEQGVIGDVLQVLIMAPHNLNAPSRPDWFFEKNKYGGILTDIGSHQFEQFLNYTGATSGKVNFARVENFGNPDTPELEDFGEASLTLNTGASCYCRLDWFNPGGLRGWGDGRSFVLGTKGTIEIRKYLDVARETSGNRIFLVDGESEKEIECQGKIGYPFFGELILDVLNRTEKAMTQEHAFLAAELSMQAQAVADAARTA
ncbi:MAG: Gfo/Idh/MocA family oxidoreductase [Kiritimatiellae bacterium]|nr:Gfo/Idh/MocA family oxidoreductase [Kiritimatiellia bacterium]